MTQIQLEKAYAKDFLSVVTQATSQRARISFRDGSYTLRYVSNGWTVVFLTGDSIGELETQFYNKEGL